MGVDIARHGEDHTVIRFRRGAFSSDRLRVALGLRDIVALHVLG
jgi:hypothetical protein